MIKVLIVEARFYDEIHDALLEGAVEALTNEGVEYDVITLDGALEIPALVNFAHKSEAYQYDGYVCLGCVIRGETSHYDYVCAESCRGIMDLSIKKKLAISNGILTVENKEQAMARADKNRKNKGGAVARACLQMIEMKRKFGIK